MKFHQKLFQIFLLFLPTQLAYHFWPDFAFVNGIRIDYLSPTIYFTDILLFLFMALWFYGQRKHLSSQKLKITSYGLLITSYVILNILFSLSPLSSLLHWLRILEAVALFIYVKNNIKDLKQIITPLSLGIIITTIIALFQIALGRNLGGLLYWLGERPLNINQPGVALVDLFGRNTLRPYGTFPHPNALAGYAGLFFLFVLQRIKKTNLLYLVSMICSLVLVILSFSQAVWLALPLSLVFLRLKKLTVKPILLLFIVVSLLSPLIFNTAFFNENSFSSSITQRIDLSLISGKVIAEYPIVGVGLGQFVRAIPNYISQGIWLIQPVHNIPLLLTAELGIVGIVMFTVYMLKRLSALRVTNYTLLVFVLITGMFDHYWLTSHQNLFLLVILFGTIKTNGFIHKQ